MLDIIGKDVKLWKNKHEGGKGVWYSYNISVSRKKDSEWLNKPVKLFIPRDIEVPSGIKNGSLVDFKGFPTLDVYTGRDGAEHIDIMVFVQELKFKDHEANGEYDSFEQAGEDIPF